MAHTRYPFLGSLLALVFLLALAGCASHGGSVGNLVKDAPASPADGAVASTQAPAPSSSPAAGETSATARAPAGTGALEPAPTHATDPGAGGRHLDRIHFALDSYLLEQPARATLQENAQYLAEKGPVPVRVEGHCDERGSAEYNLALGERRAQSAADYLQDLGIASERLQVVSYGEERPLDQSHSEMAWASNRRAEFVEVAK